MILAGVKLMAAGMTTVILFLILMILSIELVARCLAAKRAKDSIASRGDEVIDCKDEKRDDIAVIAAAVAAYEEERFSRAG